MYNRIRKGKKKNINSQTDGIPMTVFLPKKVELLIIDTVFVL
jgi:hypothetical protein